MHLPWAHRSNYHWFFDCLPRLFYLVKVIKEPIIIIVNADISAFQLETLHFILKENLHFQIEYIGKNAKWTVEKFIYASFVTNQNSGFLPNSIANFLREKIWQGYGVTAGTTTTRLYLSRSKASKRRILNENELFKILQQNNFEIIYAEDLTYQEQVKLFYRATHIVAPHGAGLTNILFSKNCSILEIQAADVVKPHYFLAAKSLGHTYDFLLGSESDSKFDFSVEAELFNQKIRQMVAV